MRPQLSWQSTALLRRVSWDRDPPDAPGHSSKWQVVDTELAKKGFGDAWWSSTRKKVPPKAVRGITVATREEPLKSDNYASVAQLAGGRRFKIVTVWVRIPLEVPVAPRTALLVDGEIVSKKESFSKTVANVMDKQTSPCQLRAPARSV